MPSRADCVPKFGKPLPDETLEIIKNCKVALKGPIGTPVGKALSQSMLSFAKPWDLYANFRPAKSYPESVTFPDVDLIVIRENTEGLYSGGEHQVAPGVVRVSALLPRRPRNESSNTPLIKHEARQTTALTARSQSQHFETQ